MKSFFKKSAIMVVVLALSLTAFVACGKTEGSGNTNDKITEGYFAGTISTLKCFYNFKEDNTYYAVFFGGGVKDAGTYEVLEKDMDYYETYEGTPKVAVESSKKTAKRVVKTTSYSGTVTEIAWHNDKLCDFNAGGMSGHAFLSHDASYVDEDDLENLFAYEMQKLYYQNDSKLSLSLYHNGSFNDMTPDATTYEGTYTINENVYTLNEESGKTFTLTVNVTEGTATYVRGTDDTIELSKTLIPTWEFSATIEAGTDKDFTMAAADPNNAAYVGFVAALEYELKIECNYVTKKYVLVAKASHAQFGDIRIVIDEGTYTDAKASDFMAGMAPKVIFTSDSTDNNFTLGNINAQMASASAMTYSVEFECDGEVAAVINLSKVPVPLDATLTFADVVTLTCNYIL